MARRLRSHGSPEFDRHQLGLVERRGRRSAARAEQVARNRTLEDISSADSENTDRLQYPSSTPINPNTSPARVHFGPILDELIAHYSEDGSSEQSDSTQRVLPPHPLSTLGSTLAFATASEILGESHTVITHSSSGDGSVHESNVLEQGEYIPPTQLLQRVGQLDETPPLNMSQNGDPPPLTPRRGGRGAPKAGRGWG